MEELQFIHENTLLKSQIQTQENTFQNISREIHDNIGQKLTLAKLQLNTMVMGERKDMDALINVVNMITESLDDLRDISRSLSSDIIKNNGLARAVENEILLISKTCPLHIELKVNNEPSYFSAEDDLVIFRIIQESLTNIIKHADASEVNIDLVYNEKELIIYIQDNGRGFDTKMNSGRNGLLNMKSRAEFLQGYCLIQSAINSGTCIICHIPQKKQTHA